MRTCIFFAAVFSLGACRTEEPRRASDPPPAASSSAVAAPSSAPVAASAPPPAPSPAPRPYAVKLPRGGEPSSPAPLILALHGYGSDGRELARWFRLEPLADALGAVVAIPDGTRDPSGKRFWNASNACCNFFDAPVDDVAYLASVIDDASAKHKVDPARVFVVGHSNGAFMAMRLACELAPKVAAIVAVAGAQVPRCEPRAKVAILDVHGTADQVIKPAGGRVFDRPLPAYPSLDATLASWARANGCTGELRAKGPALDLDVGIPGAETRVSAYEGCPKDGAVELWAIDRGGHAPWVEWGFAEAWGKWLVAHGRSP